MWAINTHNMPSLRSFHDAESFWNKAVAWKNRDQSWRPLDDRRMDHKRLVKNSHGGFECTLYRTPLVIYYPDTVEVQLHHSNSSSMFIWRVAPKGLSLTSQNGMRFWEVNTPDGVRYYTSSRDGLEFSAQGNNIWQLENKPDHVNEWVYDRKIGAETRKLIKPYTIWYEASKRLGLVVPRTFTRNTKYLRDLLERPDDSSIFLELNSQIGSPAEVIKAAYLLTGAHTQQSVPHDRLPRKTRL